MEAETDLVGALRRGESDLVLAAMWCGVSSSALMSSGDIEVRVRALGDAGAMLARLWPGRDRRTNACIPRVGKRRVGIRDGSWLSRCISFFCSLAVWMRRNISPVQDCTIQRQEERRGSLGDGGDLSMAPWPLFHLAAVLSKSRTRCSPPSWTDGRAVGSNGSIP